MTNCCNAWGNCTQGRECPARTGKVTHAQACHAARVAKSHPHPANQPTPDLPVVFVGPEPIEPTRPLDDDGVPLTPRETRQLMAGITVACMVFVGAVFFCMGYGWTRFGLDVMTYLSGVAS